MKAIQAVITVVLASVTFVGVTFLVAWLLEAVIYFSLFVGIPAGILSAFVVAVVCVFVFGRAGALRGVPPPP